MPCDGGGAGAGPTHHRPVGVGLRRGRACGPDIRAVRGFPPALDERQREELNAAVQELPEQAGIQLANWYWRGVRQFVWERFGTSLSRSSCLNWLHRLGFAFKRPKKRLLKADEDKRVVLRGGVRRPVGRGGADWRQDILCRRGPLPDRDD